MKNNLGLYLKSLRKQHNMTQEYVAAQLHVIRQSYSHYETGRTTPTLEALCQLSKLYEVPIQALIAYQLPPEIAKDLWETHEILQIKEPLLSFDDVVAMLPKKEKDLIRMFHKLEPNDQQDIIDFIKVKIKRK